MPDSSPTRELDRRGRAAAAGALRRARCDGGADEAPGVEDVERAVPLAHEVGGGSSPDSSHATAREERDLVASREPGAALGRVARCCVLGEQTRVAPRPSSSWSAARIERERGLGHPGACRERLGRTSRSARGGGARRRRRRAARLAACACGWRPGPCVRRGSRPAGPSYSPVAGAPDVIGGVSAAQTMG